MWTTELLSQVATIVSGNSVPAKKKEALFAGVEGMPYVATKDISYAGAVDYDNGICIPETYLSEFRISPIGATLICAEGGSAGRKIAYSSNECCYVNKLVSLQPNQQIAPKFLYYYALSNEFQSQFKAALHGLIGGVSLTKMRKFYISYPPLAEQQRIVAKLDAAFAEIDRAIEVTNSKILHADGLLSVFLEQTYKGSFKNHKQSSLGDVCQFLNGKAHEKDIDENGNYVVVNSKFISSNGYVKKFSNKQMFPLIKGDIVMVMSDVPNGKALAKTFLIDENDKYSLNQRICCIRTKLYQPEFLQSLINRHHHFLKFNNGENQTNLRKNDILDCPLPVVPLDEQAHALGIFKEFTSCLREVKNTYLQNLQNLKALKSAILAQELQSEAA